MKLLVFPGLGDPFHEKYYDVYNLIKKEGENRDFKVEIFNFPGHHSYDINSILSVDTIMKIIEHNIIIAEKNKEHYHILLRSYSTTPFLMFLFKKHPSLKFLKKAIIWGTVCYDKLKKLEKNLDKIGVDAKSKGVNISGKLVKDLIPNEKIISTELNLNFPICFCSGSLDDKYTIECHKSLEKLNVNDNIYFPDLIVGEKHVISSYNKEYLDLIFD